MLEGSYADVGSHYEELGAGKISISTYWFESNGKVDTSIQCIYVCMS